MALIGKIRERSGLLVAIIGIALLAFILNDYDKIFGGSGEEFGYGTIFGEKVNNKEYEDAVKQIDDQQRIKAQQERREYTQQDQDAAADNAWNMIVDKIVLEKEYEALGIDVSENEFDAFLYGRDGFPMLQGTEQFIDSTTGVFNPKLMEKWINDQETNKDPAVQQQWADQKKKLIEGRKRDKYTALISQGVYVTKLESEDEYMAQKEIKSISYVVRRFSEIPDEKIKVTDKELKAYYEAHKEDKKYENKTASREIRLFMVDIKPSRRDTVMFDKSMREIKKQFAASKNDSLFVMQNSEIKFYSSAKIATAVPEGNEKAQKLMSYPMAMDTVFRAAAVGEIVGPYSYNGSFIISKVQGGSVPQGGVIDNFIEADMVPEFGAFVASKPIGTIGVVKTDYGIHIIEVLERDDKTYPVLASIYKAFKPTQETMDQKEREVYNLLYKLDAKISKKESIKDKLQLFDTIAVRAGYFPRPLPMKEEAPSVSGFTNPTTASKLLALAFNEEAKVGDLVGAPIKDKDKYIIAILSSIREKGVPTFEDVEAMMKQQLIEEKKAKRFTNQLLKDKTLQGMAKRGNTEVMKAEVTFYSAQITGAGFEPEVVGALFSALKDGKRTLPLKGKMGVYVIRIEKTIKAPAAANYDVERDQILTAMRRQVQSQFMEALKKKAEVVDNRKLRDARVRF
ncbi:MAG: SurA N-terminal domain-containing protein [Cryomorphaceae bacterium]|nr:SurA N-terminal domain-containing protein [Cryomorphaceae bacterium]